MGLAHRPQNHDVFSHNCNTAKIAAVCIASLLENQKGANFSGVLLWGDERLFALWGANVNTFTTRLTVRRTSFIPILIPLLLLRKQLKFVQNSMYDKLKLRKTELFFSQRA